MKMDRKTYAKIETGIGVTIDVIGPERVAAHRAFVSPKRYRWDLLWATIDGGLNDVGYTDIEGLNDTHIDTALRRITKTGEQA